MSEDPYSVLGVARDATQEEIRKAYRDLAKKLHPDLNPGDSGAEDRFKAVQTANAILGDKEKRARFDRGEIDAAGDERPPQHFYRRHADAGGGAYDSAAGYQDFGDLGDLFSDLFGRAGQGARGAGRHGVRLRGGDVRYHLKVDFLDAARGGRKRVTMPDGADLDVAIPAGVTDGQALRLRGKGMPGLNGGEPGDALVEIEVATHPVFRRDGLDIHVDLPVALDEAVLGGKVEVPTIAGRVSLAVPRGASSGGVRGLKGRGTKGRDGATGDQLVHLQVVLPERIDDELETFMRGWRESHRYDPRGGLGEAA